MSWKRFTRGDCPVCNGARKDCRQNNFNNLVHCRDREANPVDWVFLKSDILGFGIWAYKADREAWNEKRREKWRRKQEIERKRAEKREQKQQKQSLSNVERDREIRKILSQLSLSDRTRLSEYFIATIMRSIWFRSFARTRWGNDDWLG